MGMHEVVLSFGGPDMRLFIQQLRCNNCVSKLFKETSFLSQAELRTKYVLRELINTAVRTKKTLLNAGVYRTSIEETAEGTV